MRGDERRRGRRQHVDFLQSCLRLHTIACRGELPQPASISQDGAWWRSRHRFGDGRYRYFDRPLPDTIDALRTSFYRHLAPIANDWSELLRGEHEQFPLDHEELLKRCAAAGQVRPTPLILHDAS